MPSRQAGHVMGLLQYAKVKSVLFPGIYMILDCGNGIIEGTETCDDGNTDDGKSYLYLIIL